MEESDATSLSGCHSVRALFKSSEVGRGWERMQSQPPMAPPHRPCHRDFAQLAAFRTSLRPTRSPWRCILPCSVVCWSPVFLWLRGVRVQALCGHHSHPLPWVLGVRASGSPLLRGPGGAPFPSSRVFASAPTPPGLPGNLPVSRLLQEETVCR